MTDKPSIDIADWKDGAEDTVARWQAMAAKSSKPMKRFVELRGLHPADVYALLAIFISQRPNGFYTFLGHKQGRMPGDNLIWWDFALKSKGVLLTVRNGVAGLYCEVWRGPDAFDPGHFFTGNLERHRERVEEKLKSFERHEIFVNHYASYARSLSWTLEELKGVHLVAPPRPADFFSSKEAAEMAISAESDFVRQSLKFHVLAKSFVLNAAFKCEALANTLLRLGSPPPLRINRKAAAVVLKSNFRQKLEVLHCFSFLFEKPIPIGAKEVQATFQLMEKRNKYVHAEDSEHTRLDDALFDGPFPLHGNGPHSPVTEFALRAYHLPSMSDVQWASETEQNFAKLVLGCVRPQHVAEVEFMLRQNQIGFDRKRAVFSVPYPDSPFLAVFQAGAPSSARKGATQ